MNRFIFTNPKLCAGCDACVDACADAHKAAGLQPQARISIIRNGDVSTPITCRQCENAPCAKVCPVDAIKMGEGVIELSEADCIGCKLCAVVCPFGVISFSSESVQGGASSQEGNASASNALENEERTVAIKCDLCDFAEHGPSCVRACATKALFLVDTKTMKRSSNAKRKTAANSLPPFMGNATEQKT